MLTPFFSPQAVVDWPSASRCNTALYGRYFWEMIARGVYLPCSQFECLFLSTAHSEPDVDATIAAARESLVAAVSA
jgi:glutamate-1-semialdehyde 2,1-aminomutase